MKRTSASQKYWLAFGEFTQMNRDMNMRHETWTWDMNMRYETWTWDMDMGHETWIWDMDMGHETWIWDMNTKLKVRVTLHAPVLAIFITCSLALHRYHGHEAWIWDMNTKLRVRVTLHAQRYVSCFALCLELIKEDWLIKMSINGWLNRLALHRYLRLSTHYP